MHCPERWGYCNSVLQTKGPVKYVADPSRGVQEFLHEIYYAQKSFHKKNGVFTANFANLGSSHPSLARRASKSSHWLHGDAGAPEDAGARNGRLRKIAGYGSDEEGHCEMVGRKTFVRKLMGQNRGAYA
jgi:hypothetical protein